MMKDNNDYYRFEKEVSMILNELNEKKNTSLECSEFFELTRYLENQIWKAGKIATENFETFLEDFKVGLEAFYSSIMKVIIMDDEDNVIVRTFESSSILPNMIEMY